jgi:4,5-DOPA dioxygenase extradiol
VFDKLKAKDIDSLVEYCSLTPHGVRAHPTDEHFLPFFFAVGAAADTAKPERVFDDIEAGVLAMDPYVFS